MAAVTAKSAVVPQVVVTQITAGDDDATVERDVASHSEAESRGSILSVTTVETQEEPVSATSSSQELAARDAHSGEGEDEGASESHEPHPSRKGLLLLAEMSSEGNLMTGAYTEQCVSLARQHRDFVLGFIAQRSLNVEPEDNFITLTPGVSLPPLASTDQMTNITEDGIQEREQGGDDLGQRYNSPRRIILEQGSDVIIVGRGILKASNRKMEAERYRREAWKAYEERIKKESSRVEVE